MSLRTIIRSGILALALNNCNCEIEGTVVNETRSECYGFHEVKNGWNIAIKTEEGNVVQINYCFPIPSPAMDYVDLVINPGDRVRIKLGSWYRSSGYSYPKKVE